MKNDKPANKIHMRESQTDSEVYICYTVVLNFFEEIYRNIFISFQMLTTESY